MRLERSSVFLAPAAVAADAALDPQAMCFLLRPFVTVEPLDPPSLPPRWSAGRYRVRLSLLGIIPIGWQDIIVSEIRADPEAGRWSFRDDGAGFIARRWDHRLAVDALPDGRVRYTDRLDVEAGLLTPAAWLFAWLLFRWRHRRWRKLLRDRVGLID